MLILFVLTVLSANLWPSLPSGAAIILSAALACICLFVTKLRALSAIFGAIALMGCHGHYYQQAIHQADQLNHEVEIRIESVQDSSQSSHPRIVASMPELWPYFSIALTWPDDAPLPTQGDRWQVKTRTKPPHDYANPASFNYRRYLLSHGIIATGYVQSATLIKASSGTGLQTWRDDRADKLQAYDNSALLAALTLGLRNGMTQAQWQVFAQTGTSHLMAISGLHLGMAFSWFWILFSFLGSTYNSE